MGSAGMAVAAAPQHDATLLDTLLPTFDFGNRHALTVAAPPARVFAAAESFRMSEDGSWLVRLLFRLRGLPPTRETTRRALAQEGFTVLAEAAGEEIVFGIAGRFWTLDERANLITVSDAKAFVAFAEPGTAKGAMSLRVTPRPDGMTCLTTETRVACVDAAAYRRFALYWLLIKPFSGWIRRDMLHAIARHALADAR
jgi:hypothetical protein